MTDDIDEIVRALRRMADPASTDNDLATIPRAADAIERLKASIDRMEQDWSDDNKANADEIVRLKGHVANLQDIAGKQNAEIERLKTMDQDRKINLYQEAVKNYERDR